MVAQVVVWGTGSKGGAYFGTLYFVQDSLQSHGRMAQAREKPVLQVEEFQCEGLELAEIEGKAQDAEQGLDRRSRTGQESSVAGFLKVAAQQRRFLQQTKRPPALQAAAGICCLIARGNQYQRSSELLFTICLTRRRLSTNRCSLLFAL